MPLFVRPQLGPSLTVSARSALPPARALEIVAPIDLRGTNTGWGPFPAVVDVEGRTGAWDGVGQTRRLHLADGGTVTETIVEYTPGVGFAYELTGFTDVFDRLIHGVRGEWTCTADASGCIVRWTWEFKPRFARGPLLRAVILPLWHRYMRRVIATTVRQADAMGAA